MEHNTIRNHTNIIETIKNTTENVTTRIGKQYNKILNLILAVTTPDIKRTEILFCGRGCVFHP